MPCRRRQAAGPGSFLGLAALCLAALAGCGVKTAPYPAEATLPTPVVNLSQNITPEGELILSWLAPQVNRMGRPLKSLGGFKIEMSDNAADENYCAGCPHRYETVDVTPPLAPPPGLELAAGPYNWRYKLTPGHVYRFRVSPVSRSGGSHPSSRAETVVWALPQPGALTGFAAVIIDKAVNLSWDRPPEGSQVEVEKRRSPDGAWTRLSGLDGAGDSFLDLAVAYETSYDYRGRLISVKEASSVPGPWSEEISLKVVDIVPPNPPGYLDAVLIDGGVRLSWGELYDDPEAAYYRVYRKLSTETDFRFLGQTVEKAFFDLLKFEPGLEARYHVTVVDKSPEANESLPSPAADVLLEPPVEPQPRPE